jgi:hypothetical protein
VSDGPLGANGIEVEGLELSREHGYGAFEPRATALVETESAPRT